MSGSGDKKLIRVAIVALAFVIPSTVGTQGSPRRSSVVIVERLMHAAFPELASQHLRTLITIDSESDGPWLSSGILTVSVIPKGYTVLPYPTTIQAFEKQFFEGFFDVKSERGYVEKHIFAASTFTHEKCDQSVKS